MNTQVPNTSSEREIRQEAQSTLRNELRQFAESFSHDLHFEDEHDPEHFSHGHISISPLWDTTESHQFWVTENYVGPSIYDDEGAVPTTWTYDIEQGYGRRADGTAFTKYSLPVTVGAGNIGGIIAAAREWADQVAAENPPPEPLIPLAVQVVSNAATQDQKAFPNRADNTGAGLWESRTSAYSTPVQSPQTKLGM